jgi:hypothetical protein
MEMNRLAATPQDVLEGADSRKSRFKAGSGSEDIGGDEKRRTEIGCKPFDARSRVNGVADHRVF